MRARSRPAAPGAFPARICITSLISFAFAAAAWAVAPTTVQISHGMDGQRARTGAWHGKPALSTDGRFVAFASNAENLAPVVSGTTNVFLKNRATGALELVNRHANGSPAAGASEPAISADGRYVAFASDDPGLTLGDTNSVTDVFVRDRVGGTVERVSVSSSGQQGNGASGLAVALSSDGRYVVFHSLANNLVADDTNTLYDVFVHDRALGSTERISTDQLGSESTAAVAISADGRYVAYSGQDPTRVLPPNNFLPREALVRDRVTGTLTAAGVSTAGDRTDADCLGVSLSENGRYVAFTSAASNLAPGGLSFFPNIYLRDLSGGTTELISYGLNPQLANGSGSQGVLSADGSRVVFTSPTMTNSGQAWSLYVREVGSGALRQVDVATGGIHSNRSYETLDRPAISGDGRYIAFGSEGTNLDPADQNSGVDLFVRDDLGDVTTLVSMAGDGTQGIGGANSSDVVVSADGEVAVFRSNAHNLVPGDTNRAQDIFAWSRATGAIELISVPTSGWAATGDPSRAQVAIGGGGLAVSGTGRYVAFSSQLRLAPEDQNDQSDVYVRDRETLTTRLVSFADGSSVAGGDVLWADALSMSADGRFICFSSYGPLVPEDTNGHSDIYVRDQELNRTERVSIGTDGNQSDESCYLAMISADGRYVAFTASGAGLVPGDSGDFGHVYLRDRLLGTTERVSLTSTGAPVSFGATRGVVSADGRYVAFVSNDPEVVPGGFTFDYQVFVRDRLANTTERVSVATNGEPLGGGVAAISPNGRYLAFSPAARGSNGPVYRRDLLLGVTRRIDSLSGNVPGRKVWVTPSAVSATGRFVVFSQTDTGVDAFGFRGSVDVYVTDLGGPALVPGDFSARAVGRSVRLTWTDRGDDESGFRLERKPSGGTFQLLATLPAGTTSYEDNQTDWLTAYDYRLQARSPNGDSEFTPVVSATTGAPVPASPTNLAAIPLSSTSIRVDWEDADDLETGFVVERSTDGEVTWATAGTTGPNVETLTDENLQPGTEYRYRLRAFNAEGSSDPSPSVTAATWPLPPSAPAGFTAAAVSGPAVRLTWTDTSSTETGFRLERRTGSGEYAMLHLLDANVTSYEDSDLPGQTPFTYRLVAFNAGGESAPVEATITTRKVPGGKLILPREIQFGNVKIGVSKTRKLVIRNGSNKEELRVTISPINGLHFTAPSGVYYLPAGGKLELPVTFSTQVRLRAGAEIRVLSSDPRNGSRGVRLSGKGK